MEGGEPPRGPAEPALVAPVGTPYETDVAPDLIADGRSPDRAEAPDSVCSLAETPNRETPD
jgi:hypothetical protein